MPIKFAANVTTRISTVNLERQLLHALLTDKLNLQRTMGRHRSDFFTNQSRLFIYDCISTMFNERRMTLNREQFDFEIQKRFDSVKDKTRIDDFSAEFDLVKNTPLTEELDSIIQNLEEVQLANSTEALIREAYAKLESGSYTEAADILKRKSIDLGSIQKENRIYNLHKDSDDWFEEVKRRKEHPETYAGIPTGFKEFDERTGGLFPAELTVVFGLSGKGKSTLMKAIACNIRKLGKNVLHCGNEENEFQMRSKYMSADSGTLYTPFKRGTYTDDEFASLKKYSEHERNANGAIYIYEFPQQTDATWIERAYHQLELQGIHIDAIVVDYLDLMKPCEKAYSENDEGGKVTSDLKQIAINCNCPVITATQAGIQSEKQETKEHPFLNQSDVFGTKRKVHSANCLIGIVNQTATAQANELGVEKRRVHHLVLCVPKNRDGAVFTFRQVVDTHTGQFMEDDGQSDDEHLLRAIANQALKMIDDTQPPGAMVSEISVDAMEEARKERVDREMQEMKQEMELKAASSQTVPPVAIHAEEDPFLGGCSSSAECASEETVFERPEEPADVEDDFLSAPSADGRVEASSAEEPVSSGFLEDAPRQEPEKEQDNGASFPQVVDDEPLTPFDGAPPSQDAVPQQIGQARERSSDSIAHKMTFAELMALKRKKANG